MARRKSNTVHGEGSQYVRAESVLVLIGACLVDVAIEHSDEAKGQSERTHH